MSQYRLGALDTALRVAGIPIDGVSLVDYDPVAVVGTVIVQFRPEATDIHRDMAAQIVAGFDWHDQVAKDIGTLRDEYVRLPDIQRQALDEVIAAKMLQTYPDLATENAIGGIGGRVSATT